MTISLEKEETIVANVEVKAPLRTKVEEEKLLKQLRSAQLPGTETVNALEPMHDLCSYHIPLPTWMFNPPVKRTLHRRRFTPQGKLTVKVQNGAITEAHLAPYTGVYQNVHDLRKDHLDELQQQGLLHQ